MLLIWGLKFRVFSVYLHSLLHYTPIQSSSSSTFPSLCGSQYNSKNILLNRNYNRVIISCQVCNHWLQTSKNPVLQAVWIHLNCCERAGIAHYHCWIWMTYRKKNVMMTTNWVHGVGHSPVCQILVQIVVRAMITSSPPAWMSSAGMLLTPANSYPT